MTTLESLLPSTGVAALSIGLIGAGRIGKVHAAAIVGTASAQLVAVCDADADAADDLAYRHGATVTSAADILADDSIGAVLIATSTDSHADLVERAARAGKAIFCEKPLDLDVARVRACLAVVEETGAPLMVGFNRRFDPNFRALHDQIAAGVIGDVETVCITSRDPSPPPMAYLARSGGLFRDMTIHDFDMARFVLGEEPVSVSAAGSALVDAALASLPDIDTAAITLVTASGRIAQICNSRRATYGYDQRVEVHGSTGMIRADNVHESTVEVAGSGGYVRRPLQRFFVERYMAAYRAEVAAFVRAVLDGTHLSPDGDAGLRALVLAEAAARSHAERRTVDIDEI